MSQPFSAIKDYLSKIYTSLKRDVDSFKHTYSAGDYIILASVKMAKTNVPYFSSYAAALAGKISAGKLPANLSLNYFKEIPVGFSSSYGSQLVASQIKQLNKVGYTAIPINATKSIKGINLDNLKKYLFFDIDFDGSKRIIKYDPSIMDCTVVICTVNGFLNLRAKQTQIQNELTDYASDLTRLRNNLTRVKPYLTEPMQKVNEILRTGIDAEITSLQNSDLTVLIKKDPNIGIIGIDDLIVIGIICGIVYLCKTAIDAVSKWQQRRQLVKQQANLSDTWLSVIKDPAATPAEKATAIEELKIQTKATNDLQKDISKDPPGALDKIENIALVALFIFAISKFSPVSKK